VLLRCPLHAHTIAPNAGNTPFMLAAGAGCTEALQLFDAVFGVDIHTAIAVRAGPACVRLPCHLGTLLAVSLPPADAEQRGV